MTLFLSEHDHEKDKKALRSLVTTLEFATDIIDSLPITLLEIEETKEKLHEALFACCLLKMSNNFHLRGEPTNDQIPEAINA